GNMTVVLNSIFLVKSINELSNRRYIGLFVIFANNLCKSSSSFVKVSISIFFLLNSICFFYSYIYSLSSFFLVITMYILFIISIYSFYSILSFFLVFCFFFPASTL